MTERRCHMSRNNYPQSNIDSMNPEKVQRIVNSLRELHDMGRPKTDQETERRIEDYFSLCEQSGLRPGVESLCLALHVSRTTLFRWCNGDDCSPYKQELIQSAKAFIAAFIEQALVSGQINPVSGIFLMKNWLNYKDKISIEEATPIDGHKHALTAAELPKLGQASEGQLPNFREVMEE